MAAKPSPQVVEAFLDGVKVYSRDASSFDHATHLVGRLKRETFSLAFSSILIRPAQEGPQWGKSSPIASWSRHGHGWIRIL